MKLKTRHEERVFAFLFLYSVVYDGVHSKEVLQEQFLAFATTVQYGDVDLTSSFAWELARGVWENTVALDALLEPRLRAWKLERVAKTELCILRMALYEACFAGITPYKVVLKEALLLVKEYSGEDSCSFVNALLEATHTALNNAE